VHRLRLAERQHRSEHAHPHPPRAHERSSVDDAHVGVLAAGRPEDPHPSDGRVVAVARLRGGRDGALDEISLPVHLLDALERVQRLEHAQVGTGNHAAKSSVRRHPLCSRHPREGAESVQQPDHWAGTEPIRIVAPDGTTVGDPDVGLDPEGLQELLRWMLLARRLDRECIALQRQGELTVYPGFEGQEAAQVGSASALAIDDFVFPTFRELAAALVRDVDPVQYLAYHRGTWHGGPYDP